MNPATVDFRMVDLRTFRSHSEEAARTSSSPRPNDHSACSGLMLRARWYASTRMSIYCCLACITCDGRLVEGGHVPGIGSHLPGPGGGPAAKPSATKIMRTLPSSATRWATFRPLTEVLGGPACRETRDPELPSDRPARQFAPIGTHRRFSIFGSVRDVVKSICQQEA